MRVVLDTNVLVSAALNQKSMPGMAALLVERCGGLLKSLAAERQLFEMVARPYFDALIDPDTRAWLMIRRRRDLNAQLAAFFGPCLWSVSALLLVGPSGPVTDRAVVKIATAGRGFSARAMDMFEARSRWRRVPCSWHWRPLRCRPRRALQGGLEPMPSAVSLGIVKRRSPTGCHCCSTPPAIAACCANARAEMREGRLDVASPLLPIVAPPRGARPRSASTIPPSLVPLPASGSSSYVAGGQMRDGHTARGANTVQRQHIWPTAAPVGQDRLNRIKPPIVRAGTASRRRPDCRARAQGHRHGRTACARSAPQRGEHRWKSSTC